MPYEDIFCQPVKHLMVQEQQLIIPSQTDHKDRCSQKYHYNDPPLPVIHRDMDDIMDESKYNMIIYGNDGQIAHRIMKAWRSGIMSEILCTS